MKNKSKRNKKGSEIDYQDKHESKEKKDEPLDLKE